MNDENCIKVVSIEGRYGQVIYPITQKQPSVADLLMKEQKKYLVFLSPTQRLTKNYIRVC